MDNEQLKSNLTSSKHWLRLLFMVFFILALQLAGTLMYLVVAVQFIFALITGKPNAQLTGFAGSLSQYIYQTLQFLTYNSEEKPFPFADWPSIVVEEEKDSEPEAEKPAEQKSKDFAKRDKFDNAEAEETEGLVREEDA